MNTCDDSVWKMLVLDKARNIFRLQKGQTIVIARHGRSTCNGAPEMGRQAVVSFDPASPPHDLDAEGVKHAERLGCRLRRELQQLQPAFFGKAGKQLFGRPVSSELERCRQTTSIAIQRPGHRQNFLFNEIEPGLDSQGLPWDQIPADTVVEPEYLRRQRVLTGIEHELWLGGFRSNKPHNFPEVLLVCTHHNLILHIIHAVRSREGKEYLSQNEQSANAQHRLKMFAECVAKYKRLVEYGSFLLFAVDEQGTFRAELHTQDVSVVV